MQGNSESTSLELTLLDPSGSKYSLRLSPADSPIDLKAYLSDFAPLSFYTNYHFSSLGSPLQDYVEFSQQPLGDTLQLVLDPFTERSSRQHLRRLTELLQHPASSYSHVISGHNEPLQDLDASQEKLPAFSLDSLVLQPQLLLRPPSSLCPFTSEEDSSEIPQCVGHIALSEFNPPSNKRKMQGDLCYLVVRTLEATAVNVTCAANGFYVNATDSAKGVFRPEASPELTSARTLVELLCKCSLGFKNGWAKLVTLGKDWNTVRFLVSVTPAPSWRSEKNEECVESEHLSMRDWNEEFQMVRSLPSESPLQRIQRDKALGKIYADFLEVAIRGARSVISGSVQPLNPMDSLKQQLFVFNHIFFSFTEDLGYTVSCIQ